MSDGSICYRRPPLPPSDPYVHFCAAHKISLVVGTISYEANLPPGMEPPSSILPAMCQTLYSLTMPSQKLADYGYNQIHGDSISIHLSRCGSIAIALVMTWTTQQPICHIQVWSKRHTMFPPYISTLCDKVLPPKIENYFVHLSTYR